MLANSLMPARAIAMPKIPPPMASRRFSRKSCRINCHRAAPTASRTAISRPRAVARLNNRPATFAQATSRTQMASRRQHLYQTGIGRRLFNAQGEFGLDANLLIAGLRLDTSARSALAMAFRSASALAFVTPGLSRAFDIQPANVALVQVVRAGESGRHCDRDEEGRLNKLIDPGESGRRHADDGKFDPIEAHLGTDGRSRAIEMGEPEIVAYNDDPIAARDLVLARAKSAAGGRLDAQDLKEIAGHKYAKLHLRHHRRIRRVSKLPILEGN